MPLITSELAPSGPPEEERLVWERACRETLRRMFAAVLADRWDIVTSLWREARGQGEWMAVAVWAGLPMTVRERIREMSDEA